MLEMLEAGLPPTKEIVLATPLPVSWWPGSIPTTRKCVNCECTAQDYKGTWFKVNKSKVLHFFFQSYRCHKCYAAEEEKGKNKKANE